MAFPEKFKSKINKWPFLLADALLVLASVTIAFTQQDALSPAMIIASVLGVFLGSVVAVVPFVIDHMTNCRLQMLYAYLENREHLKHAIEQNLIDTQDSNRLAIKELKATVEQLKMQLGQAPTQTSRQEFAYTSRPVASASSTHPNAMIAKAIAQAENNKAANTVNRFVHGFNAENKQSA